MLADTETLLKNARLKGYAIGAFNIYNLEGAAAVVNAAEEMESPVMIQLLPSALAIGGKPLVAMCLAMAEESRVPVALHLDHCPSREIIAFALKCGISSIMADGSDLSFADNMSFSREIMQLTRAACKNGAVEAELGKLSGSEDGNVVSAREECLTIPAQAAEFVDKTGVTALAVCIGNIHGKYPDTPHLDFNLLSRIAEKVTVPLVLHGTSGLPDDMITASIERGVCKFNVNTEVRSAYLETMKTLLSGTNKVELVHLMKTSIDAMKHPIQHKIKLFRSDNKV